MDTAHGSARTRTMLRARLASFAMATLAVAVTGTASAGSDTDQPASAPSSAMRLGMEIESLRGTGSVPAAATLDDLRGRLTAALDAATEKIDRGAIRLLLAEVSIAEGRSSDADRLLRDAERDLDSDAFDDDFAALRTLVQELSGDDARADEAWEKWLSRHETSALSERVALARVWNAVRRGDAAAAETRLTALTAERTWMMEDPDVRLASATVAWMRSDFDAALKILGPNPDRPMEGYLAAMCMEATGQTLPAAAAFQDVANRHPDSPFRDHALFRKADIFRRSGAFRSAAEEFAAVHERATVTAVRDESAFRRAMCLYFDGNMAVAEEQLSELVSTQRGTDVGARSQYLLAELLANGGRYDEAIAVFTELLAQHFEHDLAPRAQYRIGRCLDALGRHDEATSSYMAVVEGYSQSREAPAAAYLTGVGLLDRQQPQAAVPYFQLLLDRYGARAAEGIATPEETELLAAGHYHLLVAFRSFGDLSNVASATPPPTADAASTWTMASRLLIADALASQNRLDAAREMLEPVMDWSGDSGIVVSSGRLLAWVHGQQGHEELAVETEQSVLSRFGEDQVGDELTAAVMNRGHMLFNAKKYDDAVTEYERVLRDYPDHPLAARAAYQAGICYMRLDRAGDAVDRWETVVAADPTSDVALEAARRAAEVYFRADDYASATRVYDVLLANFPSHPIAARAYLGKAQCAYNQGEDETALSGFSDFLTRFPGSALTPEAEKGIEMALYRLGHEADGVERLQELVEQYPTSRFAADAQLDIANKLFEAERYEEATEAYRRLVSQFPSHPETDRAQFFMCESMMSAGRVADATGGYEQFLQFFPSSDLRTTVQFRLGSLRFEAGDHMRAAVDFTGVLGGDPDDETRQASLYNLALCERVLGQIDGALAHLDALSAEKLVSLDPAEIRFQIAEVHAAAGNTEQAIAGYKEALASKPSKARAAEANFRLGFVLESQGQRTGAIAAYEKVIGAGSNEFRVPALTRCALLYEEEDDLRSALRVYRALAKASPDPELVAAADQRAKELETVVQ